MYKNPQYNTLELRGITKEGTVWEVGRLTMLRIRPSWRRCGYSTPDGGEVHGVPVLKLIHSH